MIKMICFDLDGTIIDTIHSIAQAGNYALSMYNYQTHEDNEYIKFVGNGIQELVLRMMGLNEKNQDYDNVLKAYQQKYNEIQISEAKPFPNMSITLNTLRDMGYRLSCISNKPDQNVKEMVNHFYPGVFDYIMGRREDIISKPHRKHIDLLREKYGLEEDEVVYVGDSRVDYEFAKNANVKLILATYGYEDKELLLSYKPYGFISSAKELLRYF